MNDKTEAIFRDQCIERADLDLDLDTEAVELAVKIQENFQELSL